MEFKSNKQLRHTHLAQVISLVFELMFLSQYLTRDFIPRARASIPDF